MSDRSRVLDGCHHSVERGNRRTFQTTLCARIGPLLHVILDGERAPFPMPQRSSIRVLVKQNRVDVGSNRGPQHSTFEHHPFFAKTTAMVLIPDLRHDVGTRLRKL